MKYDDGDPDVLFSFVIILENVSYLKENYM